MFQPGITELTLNNSVLDPYGLTVSPAYFETAGTRLLSGRDVSWHDTAQTPYVAVVNATFARKMWGDAPAIGQRFIVFGHLREVVGVVEDSKYNEIGESPPPAFYLPFSQHEQAQTTFLVRSQRAQNEMAAALERTLSGFAPDASLGVQSWRDAMGHALLPSRAAASGLGVMGLLASMLAVTGIFGMAAYNVSRRMKELGVRVALGARTKHVMSVAVGRPFVLLGIGLFAGLLLSVFASRLLGQIVYQANARDPVVIAGAVITMALLGIAASVIPALRALAVDPSATHAGRVTVSRDSSLPIYCHSASGSGGRLLCARFRHGGVRCGVRAHFPSRSAAGALVRLHATHRGAARRPREADRLSSMAQTMTLRRARRRIISIIYSLPEKRGRELEPNLKCLQDCASGDPEFKRDLRASPSCGSAMSRA
ncbi:MAG TPA: FtsX-like permease family protein [Chthoniobacterales bacterium]|nr:FtsX-like permease family protein [Chthoniobacterales bacterium]